MKTLAENYSGDICVMLLLFFIRITTAKGQAHYSPQTLDLQKRKAQFEWSLRNISSEGQYAPQWSAADVDLAQGANNSTVQKDYITNRAWEMSHVNQTVRIFNVSFITPSLFSIAPFLSFPPLPFPPPSTNSYRSKLAGSRLSSIVGVSSAAFVQWKPKGMNISQTSTFISVIIPSFCLSFSSGKDPSLLMTGLSTNCQVWWEFFCIDFHQPKRSRECASGMRYVNIHSLMMELLKKRCHQLIGVGCG